MTSGFSCQKTMDVSLVRPPVRPTPAVLPSAATHPTIATFPSAAHPLSVPWGALVSVPTRPLRQRGDLDAGWWVSSSTQVTG
jgi:hypothetical protein